MFLWYFLSQIAKLAPSAMVHTRAESGTALIPPKWRFRQPAKAKKRDNRPLVVRARESLKHALDGWITYFRYGNLLIN